MDSRSLVKRFSEQRNRCSCKTDEFTKLFRQNELCAQTPVF